MRNIQRRSGFRAPNRDSRIKQVTDGNSTVTGTSRAVGNNFIISTSAGATELTAQLKNGTDVKLNGYDARALYRVLARHYGVKPVPSFADDSDDDLYADFG